MPSESAKAIHDAIAVFCTIHKQDPREAYAMIISIFISGYSMLSNEHRVRCVFTLTKMIRDIDGEIFEDGQDFLSFLKQKILEEGENESKDKTG